MDITCVLITSFLQLWGRCVLYKWLFFWVREPRTPPTGQGCRGRLGHLLVPKPILRGPPSVPNTKLILKNFQICLSRDWLPSLRPVWALFPYQFKSTCLLLFKCSSNSVPLINAFWICCNAFISYVLPMWFRTQEFNKMKSPLAQKKKKKHNYMEAPECPPPQLSPTYWGEWTRANVTWVTSLHSL